MVWNYDNLLKVWLGLSLHFLSVCGGGGGRPAPGLERRCGMRAMLISQLS